MAKSNFIQRWIMGRDDQPDFTEAKLPGTRWQVFKDIFKQRGGALMKTNLLMLLFLLPAIVWVIIYSLMKSMAGVSLPYSGNVGPGYPVVDDAVQQGLLFNLDLSLSFAVVLALLMIIGSVGMAGGFHVIKLLVWGEGVAVAQHFFKGIKSNALQYICAFIIIGIMLFLIVMNFSILPLMDMHIAWRILITSSVILMLLLSLMFTMFFVTQAETYKMKLRHLIRNSLLFSLGMMPQNVLFLALSLLPLLIFILPIDVGFMFMVAVMAIAFIAISYIVLVWTIYAHYVFDKYLNDNVEGAIKDRGIYRKKKEEAKESAKRVSTARRNISSIDKGSTFTPLPESYSRQDLARLARQKHVVKKEIDAELEALAKDRMEEENEEEDS